MGRGLMIMLAASGLLAGCGNKLEEAQEATAQKLIDPSSAQFRDVRWNDETVCGEVNAKNRMGGYVGFKQFYADEFEGKWLIYFVGPDTLNGDKSGDMWIMKCDPDQDRQLEAGMRINEALIRESNAGY